MLQSLSVRDVLLIKELELDFHKNLNVLTGETGAGKSILLDALGLALGERGGTSLIRPSAREAQVTALFTPTDSVKDLLENQGLSLEDGDLLLQIAQIVKLEAT